MPRLPVCVVVGLAVAGSASGQPATRPGDDPHRLFAGDLVKHTLGDPQARCNDGSPATLYLRHSPRDDKRWIVVLPGGEGCTSRAGCGVYLDLHALPRGCGHYDPSPGTPDCTEPQPLRRVKALLSSTCDAATRRGAGILSPDPAVNPHFHDANAVWLRYCSSDYWIGRVPAARQAEGIHFVGHVNLFASLDDLIERHGMGGASQILIVGNAASGAMGVLWHGDRIADYLGRRVPGAEVRLVADSAWMLSQDPYPSVAGDCRRTDPISCPLAKTLQAALATFDPQIPEDCAQRGLTWQCLMAEYRVPLLRTPIFHAQYLYDIGQLGMSAFPDAREATGGDWLWARDAVAGPFRKLFEPLDGIFAVSCYQHGFLTLDAWRRVTVSSGGEAIDVSEALHRWLRGRPARFIDECEERGCNPTCTPCTYPPDPT